MSDLFQRFRGAFISHFRAWPVLWDLACSVVATGIIARNLPHLRGYASPEGEVALYISVTALGLACLISYRRANALRSENSWVNLGEEKRHIALLGGEILASLALVWLLLLPPLVYVLIKAPELIVPSTGWLLGLLTNTFLITLASVSVFYLLSAYVVGAEGASVFAWVVIIVGFSRSDVAREVARGLSVFPFLPAQEIGNILGGAARVFTPPIEELIRRSMSGGSTGGALILAQALLQSAFALSLAATIVHQSGSLSLEERRSRARAARSAPEGSGTGLGAA